MSVQGMNHKKGKKMRSFSLLYAIFACVCAVSLCLAGCSADHGRKEFFDIDQLKNENGDFQYMDIPFGSSYKETADKLPLDFTKMETVDNPSVVLYYSNIEFYGEEAVLFVEFYDDQLQTASVHFKCLDDTKKFEEIVQRLISQYGEAESTIKEEGAVVEGYKWEQEGTYLQAFLSEGNSELSCIIGVFTVD